MHPWVGISDHVRLGVVTRWVTPELVGEVLGRCGVRDKKSGALPAGFMVYFTLAMALFQQDSYDDVAEQLVGNIQELSESIPNKSSFTRARRRLGSRVLEQGRVVNAFVLVASELVGVATSKGTWATEPPLEQVVRQDFCHPRSSVACTSLCPAAWSDDRVPPVHGGRRSVRSWPLG
ncbi:transposase domain-containing protein [Streptomyces sp. SYSU K217416]